MAPEPYEVEVKVRNNRLLEALRHAFPFAKKRREWADLCDVNMTALIELIYMRKYPKGPRGWHQSARRISEATGELLEYLFDPVLYPARRGKIIKQLSAAQVSQRPLLSVASVDPFETLSKKDDIVLIDEVMDTVSKREKVILSERFGLNGEDEHTLREVGVRHNVTQERVRQIEARAMRKMRHPFRSDRLREINGQA
jgi:RNA polymerase sigma factor (sigma-70 family)